MNSIKPPLALRVVALTAALAATSALAGGDDELLREMARTDGPPRVDSVAVRPGIRATQATKLVDNLIREMARTDGDPIGAQASPSFAALVGAIEPSDKAATAQVPPEVARTGNVASGG